MNRTIEIRIHDDAKIIPCRHSMHAAIGYLSMWGNSDHVILFIDKDLSIEASHQHVANSLDPLQSNGYRQYYFIMGLYNAEKDTYSFHS